MGSGSIPWDKLSEVAWKTREMAHLVAGGKTKVGAAILDENNMIYGGCNIQHRGRMHNEPHAETSAISVMVASGGKRVHAILVAAERDLFTPCGGCMEWIAEFGTRSTLVAFQPHPSAPVQSRRADELLPHHDWDKEENP